VTRLSTEVPPLASETPFPGARLADLLPLTPMGHMPNHRLLDKGLDGRLYTDLSVLDIDRTAIASSDFYVRTAASTLLPDTPPAHWKVRIGEHVLTAEWFLQRRMTMGEIFMECSGNSDDGGHRLMSAATFEGVPLQQVLDELKVPATSSMLMVSGFDEYPDPSNWSPPSIPGADWIFPVPRWFDWTPCLVTHMNGEPLTRDHGAPLRMVVPNWYGCCSIKWVDDVRYVPDDARSTSHMRWFAGRTHQKGIPELARDYQDPVIRPAALPIRVERWQKDDESLYRIVGIAWGTPRPANGWKIRIGGRGDYVPVDICQMLGHDRTWSMWYHRFAPEKAGRFSIQLQTDPPSKGTRLTRAYYQRYVQV
jgi:DMSO/TMAO reductase YedYZ molybdopterin-dependent catalytic subunit